MRGIEATEQPEDIEQQSRNIFQENNVKLKVLPIICSRFHMIGVKGNDYFSYLRSS